MRLPLFVLLLLLGCASVAAPPPPPPATAPRFYTTADNFPSHVDMGRDDRPGAATDVGDFNHAGSVRVVRIDRVRVRNSYERAYKRAARPCNVFNSRITIRYSNKADNLKARKQYLITAAREVGVVAEAQPAFAVVMNSMEMTLDLGRMARRSETMPRYVHVYEYVPSSGWRLLGRVSLKVPCN